MSWPKRTCAPHQSMSAFGTKRTCRVAPHMSAFGGVKRTFSPTSRHASNGYALVAMRLEEYRPLQRKVS